MFKVIIGPLGAPFFIGPQTEIVEELPREEQYALVMQQAMQLYKHGRSVNLGLNADGHWHLRRRARQVRRLYPNGVQLAQAPKVLQAALPRQRRWPWWRELIYSATHDHC